MWPCSAAVAVRFRAFCPFRFSGVKCDLLFAHGSGAHQRPGQEGGGHGNRHQKGYGGGSRKGAGRSGGSRQS